MHHECHRLWVIWMMMTMFIVANRQPIIAVVAGERAMFEVVASDIYILSHVTHGCVTWIAI